jgi:hypothetical protein
VFYNNSLFDGYNGAANAADDGAIATNKAALGSGVMAGNANITNYSRGINGLMIDVKGAQRPLTAADFEFRIGNSNNPTAWPLAPTPGLSIRTGAGVNGSDRVTLVWPDGAIVNTWLRATVKASTEMGLAASDVFYFGNMVGDSGNGSGSTVVVNASDEINARNSPRTFVNPAPIDYATDFNRDGFVNAADQIIARSSTTPLNSALNLMMFSALAPAALASGNFAGNENAGMVAAGLATGNLIASSATAPPSATLAALAALTADNDAVLTWNVRAPGGTVTGIDSHVFATEDSPLGTAAVDDQLLELLSGSLGRDFGVD